MKHLEFKTHRSGNVSYKTTKGTTVMVYQRLGMWDWFLMTEGDDVFSPNGKYYEPDPAFDTKEQAIEDFINRMDNVYNLKFTYSCEDDKWVDAKKKTECLTP